MAVEEELGWQMPIVAGPTAWPGGDAPAQLRIDLGDRYVELGGELVAEVLAQCDGRTSVAELAERHGPEAAELLKALLANGALVDGAQAWRVYHRQSSVGSALGRGATTDEIIELQLLRWSPPEGGEPVALKPAPADISALIAQRRSMRPETAQRMPSFEQLSTLLAAAGPANSASAGDLHPLIIQLLLREPLGELTPGSWWLDPDQQCLQRTSSELSSEAVAELFVREPFCDALLERGGPVVFFSANLERTQRKYGARAYRFGLIEVGAAMQSASLAAAELDIPQRVFGGINDTAAAEYLALPKHAVPLLAMIIG